jgi:arylsulfatase
MRRPLGWFSLALAAVSAVVAKAEGPGASGPGRPNIVVILGDDLGYSDIGCYGGEIRTPNLDRLAGGGLRFTRFYNNTRCCPTRASLLTGMYPHQVGVGHMVEDLGLPAYRGDLDRDRPTVAEVLRASGYRTAMAGKWHVTPPSAPPDNWPLNRGFERFFGLISSVRSYFDPSTLTRGSEPIRAPEGFYLTDAITDSALDALREFGGSGAPFFLYVAYTAPHWPMHALPEDVARYRGVYDRGWDALRAERQRRMIGLGVVDARWFLAPRDPKSPAWSEAPDKAWQAERMAVYAAMVERMDRGIGRIVDRLREGGLEQNTLLLFLADNGGCAEEIPPDWRGTRFPERTRDGRTTLVGNDPAVLPGPSEVFQSYGLPWAQLSNTPFRRFKHWVHEGGIATPLIASWPDGMKTRPGSLTDQTGHVIDLMATCLDLAGVPYPATFHGRNLSPQEGKSLRPVFEGRRRAGHEALFWEHEGNRAVLRGDWKLVAQYPKGWELYDTRADRTELHDLAGARPEVVGELSTLFDRWAERSGVRPWDEVSRRLGPAR